MSIATVVTRGFGSFGTISEVVMRGYSFPGKSVWTEQSATSGSWSEEGSTSGSWSEESAASGNWTKESVLC